MSNQGSFAGLNNGIISNCYSVINLKNLSFVGKNNGKISSSYGAPKEAKSISLDNEIWQKGDSKRRPYKFIPHLWQKISESTHPIKISNAKALIKFAQRVNNGDVSAQSAEVVITRNINLHNRKWTPIGRLKSTPFSGFFNGNGHKICGLCVVRESDHAAFFGFNEGKICNLVVDLKVGNSEVSAGFVANNNGTIENCGSVAKIINKGRSLGGFAGENYGTINRCYAAGKVRSFVFPTWIWAIPIIILLILPEIFSRQMPYKAVPFDKTQIIASASAPKEGNFVSFQFNTQATLDRTKGKCNIQYVNAAGSNKNVVLQVQIYGLDNSWETIAESKALRPGASLENAQATKIGLALQVGSYQGRAHLIYYNVDTGAREIIENNFAITIKII